MEMWKSILKHERSHTEVKYMQIEVLQVSQNKANI